MFAEFDISPLTILPSIIIAEVIVLLLGVPMLTVDPKTTAKYVDPEGGADAKVIVLPDNVNAVPGC